jgi:xanthine dehydrogenase accessory factor
VFRGGGELASGAARLLHQSGFRVVVLEREAPLAVRRLVCFAEAVWAGRVSVEGVAGRLVALGDLRPGGGRADFVEVAIDPEGEALARLRPPVLVDARMAKRSLDTHRALAPLVIGLGPGFRAGQDVHAVVETVRGPALGRVLWTGTAEPDTRLPTPVMGYAEERVLRAPSVGAFRGRVRIGELVAKGALVGWVDGAPVHARIAGLLRGLVADGVRIAAGVKLGDVDPRGPEIDPARLSDKAQAVAAGVLDAVRSGLVSRAGAVAAP